MDRKISKRFLPIALAITLSISNIQPVRIFAESTETASEEAAVSGADSQMDSEAEAARIEATVLGSLIPISKAEICAIHPDVSPTTVEAVLGRMVKEGKIKRIGTSRSSRYLRYKE